MLPFGWYHLLKALFMKRRAKMLDLLLVAVKPEYQNKGVNALLFSDLIPVYQKLGFQQVIPTEGQQTSMRLLQSF